MKMNSVQPILTLRQWVLGFLLLLVIHVALLFSLSNYPSLTPQSPPPTLKIALLTDPQQMATLRQLPWLPDPAQFALVSPSGFTGSLWPQVDPVKPAHWPHPKSFQSFPIEQALLSLPPPSTPTAPSFDPQRLVNELVPKLSPNRGLPALLLPSLTHSFLTCDASLSKRGLLTVPPLPAVEDAQLWKPTTIQVLVSPDGEVLSAVLLPPGSGNLSLDQQALQAAFRLLFRPAKKEKQPVWGTVTFHWWPLGKTTGSTSTSTQRK